EPGQAVTVTRTKKGEVTSLGHLGALFGGLGGGGSEQPAPESAPKPTTPESGTSSGSAPEGGGADA
ncbi:MAG: hypothetical protein KDE27_17515, partial [Planctomycetes bacterium]|nr:hypothetical protein [Planctomycetota bacterium]